VLVERDVAGGARIRKEFPQPQPRPHFVPPDRTFRAAAFDDPRVRQPGLGIAGDIDRTAAPERNRI